VFSLPGWLVNDWLTRFDKETTKKICFASNRRPSIYIRPNTLKTNLQGLAEELRKKDIDFETITDEEMIKLKSHCPITTSPGFNEGLFTVQDITAARAVKTLAPRPGWKVADLCAAPGIKTVQMAEAMNNTGEIVATDINPTRLDKLRENTKRLGTTIVKVAEYDNVFRNPSYKGFFDAVLLDVPCSNTGVLARRCEARWCVSEKLVSDLTKKQKKILQDVTALLKPHARICYSTCSIQNEENEQIAQGFLSKNTDFKLESERLMLPSGGAIDYDGGYVALLARD
jgi:16S rRNA (cytosine967-C5)-methyltransferase